MLTFYLTWFGYLCIFALNKNKIVMKEIIRELEKQEKNLNTSDYRSFNRVIAGNYSLSIQGSFGHYCSPRNTYKASQYTDMELAIFKNGKWLHNAKSSVIRSFPRYTELMERADGQFTSNQVFGYVPIDLLNDLYLYLSKLK